METLLYLGKVNLYWILFYACYWLLFRKHTFFIWNRAYLIITLLTSLFIPLVSLPETEQAAPVVFYVISAVKTVPVMAMPVESAPETFQWITWIWLLPTIGSLFMLKQLVKSLWDLTQIIRSGEHIKLDNCTLILLSNNNTGSFSFFNWLAISRFDYENNPDPILRHEMVHIRQWHSLDILLIEIIKVVFWFNPAVWLYKHSLQEVHEFLADETAPNRDHYARFLVSYSLSVPVALLTNHFFSSSILKSRIKMIYKNRNSRWSLGKYLMIVPVILFALLMTAARKKLINPEGNKAISTTEIVRENAVQEITSQPLTSTSQKAIAKLDTEKVNIEGDILRESGLGIADVNIFNPETDLTVTTDPLGHFKVANVHVGSILIASHVSYPPQVFVVEKGKSSYALTFKKSQNEIKVPAFTGYQNVPQINEERKKERETATSLSSVKEQKPQFPGGDEALANYIQSNIRYPVEAMRVSIGGIALVSFTINSHGEVRKPKVIKEIGWGIDEEAIRIVLNMPKWEPARQNGKPIAMEYTLSIPFKLERVTQVKEKYQGSYPSENQSNKKKYFKFKMPDPAKDSKYFTKTFPSFDDKRKPKKPKLPDVSMSYTFSSPHYTSKTSDTTYSDKK